MMSNDHKTIPVTLIRGDGIGPELSDAVLAVFDKLNVPIAWDIQEAGQAAVDKTGQQLPDATLDSISRTKLALKGPLATPIGKGFKSVNVTLRQQFGLYANIRPIKTLVPGRYTGIDLIIVRENLEGLYAGSEQYIGVGDDPHAVGIATGFNSRMGSERIFKYAFEMAKGLGRRNLTIVHKANILKICSGVFLEAGRNIATQYKDAVTANEQIVDACAMNLVLKPEKFDVIVTTNMFGDILSDLAAGLVGGLGLAPSANIGTNAAIFEAVHGSAPDIAGQNLANPLALILSSAMLLDHIGRQDAGNRVRAAVDKALSVGQKTRDLGGTLSTQAMAAAIASHL